MRFRGEGRGRLDVNAGPCYVRNPMNIAALLPNVEIYGGVRRYLEIGNALIRRGHQFTLLTPTGDRPTWFDFEGRVLPFAAIGERDFDIGLCGEYSILPQFDSLRARAKFFYFVLEGHRLERKVAAGDYRFLGSSEGICRRIERRYGVRCLRAPGGVNPRVFYPTPRATSPKEAAAAVRNQNRQPDRPESLASSAMAGSSRSGKG